MVQTYRIALSSQDYEPPTPVYTHVCRFYVGDIRIETRHHSAEDAQRERDWQAAKGYLAQVQKCN